MIAIEDDLRVNRQRKNESHTLFDSSYTDQKGMMGFKMIFNIHFNSSKRHIMNSSYPNLHGVKHETIQNFPSQISLIFLITH